MPKYYRIKDRYILRGWEKLPYAVVDTETGHAGFIDSRYFNALSLCTGNADVSLPLVSDSDRAIIHECEEKGIVEPCKPGHVLTENQKYKKFPVRYIHSVHWSITGRCNCKCRHCYIHAPEAMHGELDHDVIMSFIPQFEECGIMRAELSGGEPLVRDDFLEIVDSLTEHNINVTQIYTNGLLVNEKLLNELDRMNLHPEFVMSYDGAGWHDWMRGVSGAEEAVNRAFALCRDKGFPTQAEMCLHRLNIHTLRESINHLASLGLGSLKVSGVMNTGEWKANREEEDNSLSFSEMFNAYLDYLPHYYEDAMPVQLTLGGFIGLDPDRPNEFYVPVCQTPDDLDDCLCGSIRRSMYIMPEGRVLPCMPMAGTFVEEKMPFIQEHGLAECINDSYWLELVNLRLRSLFENNDECRTCEFSDKCSGGCRAAAMSFDHDNYFGKDLMTCELFKGRWGEKIITLMKRIKPEAECVNLQKK